MNSASKAVRNLGKKSSNVVSGTIKYSQETLQNTMAQGVIILVLIAYSVFFVKRVPMGFLTFFDNIIVKVVSLVIIALVGLYSPAVALFLAIALIVTLQSSQKRKLGEETMHDMKDTLKKDTKSMKDHMEKGAQDVKHHMQKAAHDVKQHMQKESMMNYLDPTLNQQGDDAMESFDMGSNQVPLGYNNNSSCIGSCGGGNEGNPSLSAQCGVVKTWNNQMSAQGLGDEPVGFQSSVGYPVV